MEEGVCPEKLCPNSIGNEWDRKIYTRGVLATGETVAVKRLTKLSDDGLAAFLSEIKSISSLEHRNLVQLLGCSIQGTEKLLIYEFVDNMSLDRILFDSTKQSDLSWEKRFHIIQGIARGLSYLHRDCKR